MSDIEAFDDQVNGNPPFVVNCMAGGLADGTDACQHADCPDNSTCAATDDAHICNCNGGYVKNNGVCDEIPLVNECVDSSVNNCDANASCTDTQFSFTCACNNNYSGDGVTCTIENDWCVLGSIACDKANSECVNKETEGVCECSDGFSATSDIAVDGECVQLVNECFFQADNTCHEHAFCTDTPLAFDCICDDGYDGDGFDDTVEGSTGCTIVCPPNHVSHDNLSCVEIPTCSSISTLEEENTEATFTCVSVVGKTETVKCEIAGKESTEIGKLKTLKKWATSSSCISGGGGGGSGSSNDGGVGGGGGGGGVGGGVGGGGGAQLKCKCYDGFHLAPDGKTCQGKKTLLFVRLPFLME